MTVVQIGPGSDGVARSFGFPRNSSIEETRPCQPLAPRPITPLFFGKAEGFRGQRKGESSPEGTNVHALEPDSARVSGEKSGVMARTHRVDSVIPPMILLKCVPTYEYECPRCPRVFEVRQRISEPALAKCDRCGGPVHRLL